MLGENDINYTYPLVILFVGVNGVGKTTAIGKMADFFSILGDTTRVKILDALDKNELCVCDIANVLGMSKSSISHQLGTLRRSGIVKCRKVGKEVFYTLDDEHVKEVFEVAIEHIEHKR